MAPGAGQLIYLTMGLVADYLFGADDADRARIVLRRLFSLKSNFFSFQLAEVVTQCDTPVGLVISSPWRTMKSLEIPTAIQLTRVGGISALARMLIRARPFVNVKEAQTTNTSWRILRCCRGLRGTRLGRPAPGPLGDEGHAGGLRPDRPDGGCG